MGLAGGEEASSAESPSIESELVRKVHLECEQPLCLLEGYLNWRNKTKKTKKPLEKV